MFKEDSFLTRVKFCIIDNSQISVTHKDKNCLLLVFVAAGVWAGLTFVSAPPVSHSKTQAEAEEVHTT